MSGAVFAAALGGAAWAQSAPPPASAFGRLPQVDDVALSPSGQTIAILGGPPAQRTLSFATVDQEGLPTLDLGDVETVSIRWVGDKYVLARVGFWHAFDAKHRYRFERNISVTADGKPAGRMLSNDIISERMDSQPVLGVTSGSDPQAIMLGLQQTSGASASNDTRLKRKGDREESSVVRALWRVDPKNGRGLLIERGSYDTRYWQPDLTGEARVRVDIDALSYKYSLYGRAKGQKTWTPLISGADEEEEGNFLGYSDPDDGVYLAKPSDAGLQLVVRSLKDGSERPVGAPSKTNELRIVYDGVRGTAVGVASGLDQGSIEWLDPSLASASAAMGKIFKGALIHLDGWSEDRTRFLVRMETGAQPPTWYLYDKPRKSLSPIGEAYPELKGAALGDTRWIRYKARDGLEIPALLTLPPGLAPGAKPPLVVLPHGGPAARDGEGFDWLTQFLATRGYAVLRPQFRGSIGFGKAFQDAGRGEWGGKIQTDLLDGVAYLAAQGLAAPGQACIVGASFGGYSALAGATLHPTDYRCAASIAGMSDLGLLITEQMRAYGRESSSIHDLRKALGDASSAEIVATSPRKQVAAVQVPILLIHGEEDDVVPIEQSEVMAKAPADAGKPVEFVVLKGENHYLRYSATRTQALQALETFLAKNLPVAR